VGIAGRKVPIVKNLIQLYQPEHETGVHAAGVISDSPTGKAGKLDGDIFVSLESNATPSVDALHRFLTAARIRLIRGLEMKRLIVFPSERDS
tara:strand:- start:4551 stop:4826 length:276 start_codon:yes stop_codon:yes gene_type:complete